MNVLSGGTMSGGTVFGGVMVSGGTEIVASGVLADV